MKKAFTLVELLAATALAAMLAVAVLAVIASLGRSNRRMAAMDRHDRWPAPLVELVRFDLLNGREGVTDGNSIMIRGYSLLDPRTGEPTHKPGLIRYAVRQVAGRSWLVRTEQEPGKAGRTELLCADVAAIEMRQLDTGAEAAAPSTQSTTRPAEINSIPREVELVVSSVDPRIQPLDEVLLLR